MTWVMDNLKLAAVSALALVLALSAVALTGYLVAAKSNLKTANGQLVVVRGERDTANKALGTCQGSVADLTASLATQGAAVEALKLSAAQRERRAAEAVQRARNDAARYRLKAGEIAAVQPAPGADRCEAAAALIRQTLEAER